VTTISPAQFQVLLPLACGWAEQQEQRILEQGVSLAADQVADAEIIGVADPARVRLLRVDQIPVPEHPTLRAAAEATSLISPLTAGLTLRYGIFIRADCWGQRRLVAHELAHTAQYERLGGFQPFLQRYLWECLTIGYPEAPMEQEAIATERRLCGQRS
jgi:hypothetical protein